MGTDALTVNPHDADCTALSVLNLVTFSVIDAPHALTKKYTKKNGVLNKTNAGQLKRGTARRVSVSSATEFAQVLNSLSTHQAIMHGVFSHDAKTVYSKAEYDKLSDKTNATTRTNDHTAWSDGGGVLVLDYDAPKEGDAWSMERLRSVIADFIPLEQIAHVSAYSSSSYIFDGDQQLTGSKGLRLYVLVSDASDIPRAGKVLFDRLWLAGFGHYEYSKSGAFLVRSVIDATVWQPSRLDFAAGAHCIAPINQRRPAAKAHNGAMLDTRAILPDLSDSERYQLAAMQHTARTALEPQAALVSDKYSTEKAIQQLKHNGVQNANHEQIAAVKQQIERSMGSNVLPSDWLVMLADRSIVSIQDIYADRSKYHRVTCKDPIEHDYNDYHTCGIIYTDNYDIKIVSQAHGQRTYICANIPASDAFANDAVLPFFTVGQCWSFCDDSEHETERAAAAYVKKVFKLVQKVPVLYDTLADAIADKKNDLNTLHINPFTVKAINDSANAKIADIKRRAIDAISVHDSIKKRHDSITVQSLADIPASSHRVNICTAGTGTGKTQHFLKSARQSALKMHRVVVDIVPRISLCAEHARHLGTTTYREFKDGTGKPFSQTLGITTTINSLNREDLEPIVTGDSVVLLDEFSQTLQVFNSLRSYEKDAKKSADSGTSTARGTTAESTYTAFIDMLRQTNGVYVADATLNTHTAHFLEQIYPHERFRFIDHATKSGDGVTVQMVHASTAMNSESDAIGAINTDLNSGIACFVAVETRKGARRFKQKLTEMHPDKKILLIHSANKSSSAQDAFLKDADAASLQYDCVIHSPVLSSGVSIEHRAHGQHFGRGYYVGTGCAQTPLNVLQTIRRVRYCNDVRVYTAPPVNLKQRPTNPDTFLSDTQNATELDRLRAKLIADQNYLLNNFAPALYYTLIHHGFKVVRVNSDNKSKVAMDAAKAFKQMHLDLINAAATPDEERYEKLAVSTTRNEADEAEKVRFEIVRDFSLPSDATITKEILDSWQQSGVERLARFMAWGYGKALDTCERAETFVSLYRQLLDGTGIPDMPFFKCGLSPVDAFASQSRNITLTQDLARKLDDNARAMGKRGVLYGVLPNDYERTIRGNDARPFKRAQKIMRLLGFNVDDATRVQRNGVREYVADCYLEFLPAYAVNPAVIEGSKVAVIANTFIQDIKVLAVTATLTPSSNPPPLPAAAITTNPAYHGYWMLLASLAPRMAALNDPQAKVCEPLHDWLDAMSAAGFAADRVCDDLLHAGLIGISGSQVFIKRKLTEATNEAAFMQIVTNELA